MTILTSLAKAYERNREPPFGYSLQKVGFVISLNPDGTVANVTDLRQPKKNKLQPRMMAVPQPKKRTSGIDPNFLWDKTSYVLGVTAAEGKRTADEHAAFVELHLDDLSNVTDEGMLSLRAFLTAWNPDQFIAPLWPDEMKDENVIFALESERRLNRYLHDRPAAKKLWTKKIEAFAGDAALCLSSGEIGPIARLHPAIKGVWGAQSSGASIVTFNEAAYESYGHIQGDNAPVSEYSAFAYTTALNYFLGKDSRNRMQIGDASTVFWAEADNPETTEEAESMFTGLVDPIDLRIQSGKIEATLNAIRSGQPLKIVAPKLADGVRFHILGLAPNAARLAIRFWMEDDFGNFIFNYQRFVEDMRIAPTPRDGYPPIWRYLLETATLGKRENVHPKLAGDWTQSILTGQRYPQTIFSSLRTRIRADGEVSALRVGMLKALLIRNFKREETPVAFDSDFKDKGYLLGRLFALYERIQESALGANVNATIKNKFYGSASAQPRKVFPMIDRNSANHLAKIGKASAGQKVYLEKMVIEIMGHMSPGDDPFPVTLSAEAQALFSVGYYHQRNEFFKSKITTDTPAEEPAQ